MEQMTDNRHSVLTNIEALQPRGAEPAWLRSEVKAEEAEVRNRRILLVEDEELLRSCVRMMLEFAGHQVTEARNGAEGLSLFIPGEFDLVITDFEMPLMRGDQLAVGVKSLARSVPILMI